MSKDAIEVHPLIGSFRGTKPKNFGGGHRVQEITAPKITYRVKVDRSEVEGTMSITEFTEYGVVYEHLDEVSFEWQGALAEGEKVLVCRYGVLMN